LGNHAESIKNKFFMPDVIVSGFIQSYGQYGKLFMDVKDDVDQAP
jgi:hypothetical protein